MAFRFFRWKPLSQGSTAGGMPLREAPPAGGYADGVCAANFSSGGVPLGMGQVLRDANIGLGDIGKLEAGGAFAEGADLMTDGSGRAVAVSGGGKVLARALEASTGSGDLVAAVLVPIV